MLGKVPYTGGFLDTNKMHHAVNEGLEYLTGSGAGAGGNNLLTDLKHLGGNVLDVGNSAYKYLGLPK